MKIPFDYKKVILGAKVVTRDNRNVLELFCLKRAQNDSYIVAVIENKTGHPETFIYDKFGRITWRNECDADLIIVTKDKITGYCSLYRNATGSPYLGRIFGTEKEAAEESHSSQSERICIQVVEWEE